MNDILRGELGFQGVVVSEGGGFGTLLYEHIVQTQKEAGALALKGSPTGSPHLLQNVTTFLLKVPQCWQRMSPPWNGSVRTAAPQLRQVERRWCSPLRLPHLPSQLPIE